MGRWVDGVMKSLSPNTKIDFRKLLATVHGLPNSMNRFGSGAVWMKYFLGRIVVRLLHSFWNGRANIFCTISIII